jgi:hypothetical protein
MRRSTLFIGLTAVSLAFLLGIASLAYFLGKMTQTAAVPPPTPVEQPRSKTQKLPTQTVQGEVVSKDSNSYVVKDASGRQFRLRINEKTKVEEQPKVGDKVVARVDPLPSDVHTRSIEIRSEAPDKGKSSGIPELVEGELLKVDGTDYLVKDLSGHEVKLHTDKQTKKDGNLTLGDRVLAHTNNDVAPGYAVSITKR